MSGSGLAFQASRTSAACPVPMSTTRARLIIKVNCRRFLIKLFLLLQYVRAFNTGKTTSSDKVSDPLQKEFL